MRTLQSAKFQKKPLQFKMLFLSDRGAFVLKTPTYIAVAEQFNIKTTLPTDDQS